MTKEHLVHQSVIGLQLLWAGGVTNSEAQSVVFSKVSSLDQMSALAVFHIETLLDKTEDASEVSSLVKDMGQALDNTGTRLCHLFWTLG